MGTLNPGDQISFQRGGEYEGTLNITASGNTNNNIVFNAYGSGNIPILKGSVSLSSWTNVSGAIWKADCPSCQTSLNNLIINGKAQSIGREPNLNEVNAGYNNIDNASGQTSITDNNLNVPSNFWQGAEVVVRTNRWTLDRTKVLSNSGSTLNLAGNLSRDLRKNFGYFFQNHINCLDVNGEWYFDAANKDVYIYWSSGNPNNLSVEVPVKKYALTTSNAQYIRITNIALANANEHGLLFYQSDHVEFSHNKIKYAGIKAMDVNACTDVQILDNEIDKSGNIGINMWNSNSSEISNNTIKNTAVIAGMGQTGQGQYIAMHLRGNNNLILNNRLDSMGYIGINVRGDNNLIKRNFITNICLVKDDGGAIYSQVNANKPIFTGNRIEDNIILNSIGAPAGTPNTDVYLGEGIYLDDRSEDFTVTGNTVAFCSGSGIYVHDSKNHLITNNTVYDCSRQINIKLDEVVPAPYTIENCIVEDNIFYSQNRRPMVFRNIFNRRKCKWIWSL